MSVLRVAIPSPLRRPFDYLPPAQLPPDVLHDLQPGVRIRVPFGTREVTGYLLAVADSSEIPATALRPALEILDPAPLVDTALLQLCRWAADYYHHPPGEVFATLFPPALREGKPVKPSGTAGWQLTARGKGLPPDALPRAPRQAQVIDMLRRHARLAQTQFRQAGVGTAVLRKLAAERLIEPCTISEDLQIPCARQGLTLNSEQAAALQELRTSGAGFGCHLLEGVTGSGKTEIYLQLIADCLQRGQQALLLVPEIGLTPQTLARFQERFDARIAVLHSGLSDAQRNLAWDAARCGTAHIVIGTRSAVFTPLRAPGLIVVDEEHDSSYKQQDGFRYSARDVAVKRAQLQDCLVLLGSATPSLETLHNALLGRYRHHRLTQRAGSSGMPDLRALDMRKQEMQAGLCQEVIAAVADRLRRGQQVLLFLNRRGYAPTLQCHNCGWIAECRDCDARLTIHRRQRRLRCHHCGGAGALPQQCPHCHSERLLASGLGTEQTEDFLRTRFHAYPVYRVDSDSMPNAGSMQALVDTINRGEPCILLGTQMLTKGHHFPAVSLVVVIDADALLFSADFRGEERMAQLLTQVAGRAGRADLPGTVLLQTHYPDHPALQAMLTCGYAEQARAMLERRHDSGLPPSGQLVIVRTDCANAGHAESFLQQLRTLSSPQLPTTARLIGPLPSPMQRRAGKYRCQLLLTAPDRRTAQGAARIMVAQAEQLPARHGLNWSIDIDPQEMF